MFLCFNALRKSKNKIGFQVKLAFSISQHSRDELLLLKIIDYLGCGKLEKTITRPHQATFVVYKLSDICDKILPLLQAYPLKGVKYL
jgi:thiamine monophosphate synthase